MLALTGSYAAVLGVYGDPDWGPIYSGFLGLLPPGRRAHRHRAPRVRAHREPDRGGRRRHGHRHPALDDRTFGHLLPDPFDTIVTQLSLVAHFTPFATGALFLSDVGFFLTIVLASLFLSVRALARR